MQKRVVVAGAGFGGLAAALSISRRLADVEVVLVDAQRCHAYTPWLYEVATGFLFERSRKVRSLLRRGAHVPYEEIVRHAPGNIRFRQGRITKIDTQEKHLVFEDGMTLQFDIVALALGSEWEDYGIPGVKTYGMPLKTVADAMHIEERLQGLLEALKFGKQEDVRVVVGGAGAAGVETAAELANYLHECTAHGLCPGAVRVSLIDTSPSILNAFPKPLREAATRRAKSVGIELYMSSAITAVDPTHVITEKGAVPYDLFLWTGGIRPNQVTAHHTDVMRDPRGRLLADAFGRSKEREDVFVLGDGASIVDPRTGRPVPSAAWAAMREGKQVGENIARMLTGTPLLPLVFPRVYPAVVTVGGHYSVATVFGICFSGRLAFFLRRCIDFHYFQSILPLRIALQLWHKGAKIFDRNDHL
jgi:NADH dehydrogenase FAD-containing subunit